MEDYVCYGDSVTGDTLIWIKKDEKIDFIKIKCLFSFEGKEYQKKLPDGSTKFYKEFDNIETLSMNDNFENHWYPLKYIMKHFTKKKLYKLHFNNELSLTITEDHSLVSYNNIKRFLYPIKPKEAKGGIYNTGFDFCFNKNYEEDQFFPQLLGFIIGDGCLYKNGCNIGISSGLDKIEFEEKILKNIDQLKKTSFCDKGKRDINFSKKELFDKIISFGYIRNWKSPIKRVPFMVFEQSSTFICNFLKGIFSADGTIIIRKNKPIIRYTSTSKKLIKDLQKLLMFVGIGSTYFTETMSNHYKNKKSLTHSTHLIVSSKYSNFFMENIGFIFERKNEKYTKKKKSYNVTTKHIKKKEEIIHNGEWVYDVSVDETHRFYGNNILLKNTDSLYIGLEKWLIDKGVPKEQWESLPQEKQIEFIQRIAEPLEDHVNERTFEETQLNHYNSQEKDFKIKFEQEKIALTGFFHKKKMYATWTLLDEGKWKDDITIKGLNVVRGDSPEVVKPKIKKVLKMILRNEPNDAIKKFINQSKKELKKSTPSEIAENKTLNNINDYVKDDIYFIKGTPHHLKGLANYRYITDQFGIREKYEEPMEGNKTKILYVMKNPYNIDCISFIGWPKEFDDYIYVNYSKMIENNFIKKIKEFLELVKKEYILNDGLDPYSFFQ